MKLPIDDIIIGTRARLEVGDLTGLKASIERLGLLQPIGVRSEMTLVYGYRRWLACRELGWLDIECIVNPALDDVLAALEAERDENDCRKHLLPSEMAQIALRMVELGKQLRAGNMIPDAAHELDVAKRARRVETLETRFSDSIQRSRDVIAKTLGVSGRTVQSVINIQKNACPELIATHDAGAIKTSAAEILSRLDHDKQRELLAGPADRLRSEVRWRRNEMAGRCTITKKHSAEHVASALMQVLDLSVAQGAARLILELPEGDENDAA